MSNSSPWKPRERQIIHLLAEGLSNSEIGVRLHLAHDTVRWYNKQIFEKLGVNNRTQAVTRATEMGLLRNTDPHPFLFFG
jgi:LuxR family maltose regulon positive regulatory protein